MAKSKNKRGPVDVLRHSAKPSPYARRSKAKVPAETPSIEFAGGLKYLIYLGPGIYYSMADWALRLEEAGWTANVVSAIKEQIGVGPQYVVHMLYLIEEILQKTEVFFTPHDDCLKIRRATEYHEAFDDALPDIFGRAMRQVLSVEQCSKVVSLRVKWEVERLFDMVTMMEVDATVQCLHKQWFGVIEQCLSKAYQHASKSETQPIENCEEEDVTMSAVAPPGAEIGNLQSEKTVRSADSSRKRGRDAMDVDEDEEDSRRGVPTVHADDHGYCAPAVVTSKRQKTLQEQMDDLCGPMSKMTTVYTDQETAVDSIVASVAEEASVEECSLLPEDDDSEEW